MRSYRSISTPAMALVAVLILALGGCGTQEAKYPSGPVNMVVAWAAGGAADSSARALAESTQKHLGQSIVVQNVAGAGGATGAVQVAQAKPDGYNIIYTTASLVTQPHFEDVPYNPTTDLVPVLQVAGYPTLIVVKSDSPFKTLKDMVDFAKANPNKLNYSTTGFGSIHHVLAEMVSQKAGIKMTHVPFKSLTEGVTALLGGHIEVSTCTPFDIVGHLKDGKIRALGIFMPERFNMMPDIPTMKEQGYDVTSFGWWGVAAPKNTPDNVIQTLHDAFKKGMADPPFTTILDNLKHPAMYLSSKDTAAKWKQEFDTYGAIAKSLPK